ncbi:MAG: hypothetical protein ACQEQV_09610 [Fibrobacterota bacterium]
MLCYDIDKESGTLKITARGSVSYDDLSSLIKQIIRSLDMDTPFLRCLTDFRAIRVDLTQREMNKLRGLLEAKKERYHVRHAHVTHPENEIQASVFFALLRQKYDTLHPCVFHSHELAENWLGLRTSIPDKNDLNTLWN